METETETSTDQQDVTTPGADDQGDSTPPPEGGEQQQDTGAAPGGEGDGERRGTRSERRAEWNRRNQEQKQQRQQEQSLVAELRRHNEQLGNQLREALGRIGDVVERSTPPREGPLVMKRKALDAQYEKVLARLDKDPTAAKDFQELLVEYGRLGADEAHEARQAAEPPRPSAVAQSLTVEFPWLDPQSGDREARTMVNGEAARLARREKRDMGNPQVLYATLRQAAATVARDLGYPVPAGFAEQQNGNGRQRVTGTGGRAGAGGGGGADPYAGMESDIEQAATIMYPNLDKAAAVAKWKGTVGKRYLQAAK